MEGDALTLSLDRGKPEIPDKILKCRKEWESSRQRFYLLDFLLQGGLRYFQIVVRLKTQPKTFRSPEKSGQPQCSIRRDRPFSLDDFVDPAAWHMNILGQAVLAYIHRFQKIFQEYFSRMNRRVISHLGFPSRMIIDQFHIIGIRIFPCKTNPELIIDTDAPLIFSISFQGFQTVSRRNPKVVKGFCAVEDPQLSFCGSSQILWDFLRIFSFKDFLGVPILERFDHRAMITHCVTIGNLSLDSAIEGIKNK